MFPNVDRSKSLDLDSVDLDGQRKPSEKSLDLHDVKLKGQANDGDIVLYRYRDASGREVVTNDLDAIPKGVAIEPVSDVGPGLRPPVLPEKVFGVHVSSAAFGLTAAIVVILVPVVIRRSKLAAKLIFFGVAALLLGGLYFGWVMRTAGLAAQEDAPSAGAVDIGKATSIVRDPRDAVTAAEKARDMTNERNQKVEQVIEQIERNQ